MGAAACLQTLPSLDYEWPRPQNFPIAHNSQNMECIRKPNWPPESNFDIYCIEFLIHRLDEAITTVFVPAYDLPCQSITLILQQGSQTVCTEHRQVLRRHVWAFSLLNNCSGAKYQAPGTWQHTSGTRHMLPCIWYMVPCVWYRAHGPVYLNIINIFTSAHMGWTCVQMIVTNMCISCHNEPWPHVC